MKACIVTSTYVSPGETFVNRHIERLFGGNTCVVSGRFRNEAAHTRPAIARRGRATPLWHKAIAPFAVGWNGLRHGTSRLPFGAVKRDIARFLVDQRADVILAEFGTQALVMTEIANELGLPIFSMFRGFDASTALRSPLKVRAYRRMMPRIDGVIPVSAFLRDNLAAHGITHPNTHVLTDGVDIGAFGPGAKQPGSFLAVGRFVEKKAPEITVRAFAAATADMPDARLDLVGGGPLLERCRALAEALGASGRIHFHGARPHDEVRAMLGQAQFFLQHSVTGANGDTEGLPTSIQEALASGCIVVSTRHAGIPEAIDEGVNGFLVDEFDEKGFARHIARLASEGAPMGMAEAARRIAEERFDNSVLLARLESIMAKAVEAGRPRAE